MADRVHVETQQLRAVGGDLDGVAARIDAVLSKVKAASAAHWGKWGDDEFGDGFAEGDNGYVNSDRNLQAVLESKSALLRSYSTGLTDAATQLEAMEAANTDGFQH
ncbi:type VII secretion target [Nocardia pseudovaccinii]|uniref:type VII secretion target n=1 Tax=Nocardia pseudovaccinii TaxID=189540 RepID=UPI000AB72BA0|nr:type VII secretion target [Nocardia pseudovaccinii]